MNNGNAGDNSIRNDSKGEILVYQSDTVQVRLNVRLKGEPENA